MSGIVLYVLCILGVILSNLAITLFTTAELERKWIRRLLDEKCERAELRVLELEVKMLVVQCLADLDEVTGLLNEMREGRNDDTPHNRRGYSKLVSVL